MNQYSGRTGGGGGGGGEGEERGWTNPAFDLKCICASKCKFSYIMYRPVYYSINKVYCTSAAPADLRADPTDVSIIA